MEILNVYLKCVKEYYLNTDGCRSSYKKKHFCNKCIDSYSTSLDGYCIPCPSNCRECKVQADLTSKCINCVSNKFSLQLDGTCKQCSKAVFKNCETCGPQPRKGNTICLECKRGFSLKDDKLSCEFCSISDCDKCAHGRICTKCKKGFYQYNYKRECASK